MIELKSRLSIVMSILQEMAQLAIREHYTCEDCYYSCPKSGPEWYCGDNLDLGCNCGADTHNEKVNALLAGIKIHIS